MLYISWLHDFRFTKSMAGGQNQWGSGLVRYFFLPDIWYKKYDTRYLTEALWYQMSDLWGGWSRAGRCHNQWGRVWAIPARYSIPYTNTKYKTRPIQTPPSTIPAIEVDMQHLSVFLIQMAIIFINDQSIVTDMAFILPQKPRPRLAWCT